MIALPAVDLRDGLAVQWVGGRPATERIRMPDPVAVAMRWISAGFTQLHVVDLDAALETGSNRDMIGRIVAETGVPCQAGGGVRDEAAIQSMIDTGVRRVIVGTTAIENPAWLVSMSHTFPDRLTVAADVRAGIVVTRGWTRDTEFGVDELLSTLDALPLAGVLVTDVGREGSELGVDVPLFRRLTSLTAHPLHAAGGIASLQDLSDLETAGVAGAVLGMSLYTGRLDAETTAREFSS